MLGFVVRGLKMLDFRQTAEGFSGDLSSMLFDPAVYSRVENRGAVTGCATGDRRASVNEWSALALQTE